MSGELGGEGSREGWGAPADPPPGPPLPSTLKSYWIRKGSAFSTAVARPETELTPEMIAT